MVWTGLILEITIEKRRTFLVVVLEVIILYKSIIINSVAFYHDSSFSISSFSIISISLLLLMISIVWCTSTERGLYFLLKLLNCCKTSNYVASLWSRIYLKVLYFNFSTILIKAFFYSTTSIYLSFS